MVGIADWVGCIEGIIDKVGDIEGSFVGDIVGLPVGALENVGC